ncbi:hypothetical protein [Aliirhizobium smilacinae]|uniref:Uncharacterized protein n=1 Tax=Aliirhizobium smilacinae TaxID=1395944 RepID=A0A5C4XNM1_9HYPH|nr:hypothetical protein [Rhizobium smilacinae]TNM65042.1 hypothetical protein FHP24_01735 [Rhizobium smilacinae]
MDNHEDRAFFILVVLDKPASSSVISWRVHYMSRHVGSFGRHFILSQEKAGAGFALNAQPGHLSREC